MLDIFSAEPLLGAPTEWPRIQIRHLCTRIFRGQFGDPDQWGWDDAAQVDAIEGVMIKDHGIALEAKRRTAFPPLDPEKRLQSGDLLVKASGTPGICAVHRSEAAFIAAPDILVVRADPARALPEFLALVLMTQPYLDQTQLRDQQHLNVEVLSRYPILVPPLGEQARIVTAAATERKRTERLITAAAGQARVIPGPAGGLAGLLLERRLAHDEFLVFGRIRAA